jgi:hypothetical protein
MIETDVESRLSAPNPLRTKRREASPTREFVRGIPGRNLLCNMFGLDYRSIALLRIGLGILILANLIVSVRDIRGFYSDEGLLSRTLLLANYGAAFSLHLSGGTVGFAVAMFAIQAALALMMIAGYRTRAVTIASYVLLVSLQARNPLLTFGADIAFRVCFFFAMFLPLNRRFSLDAATGRVTPPETATYSRIPAVAYLVQFGLIYLFSGLLKTGPAWTVDYTAVSLALSLEMWSRPIGAWLNQFDMLTRWLTFLTPKLEVYAPLLLILPVWSGRGRMLGWIIFTLLQIGFNVCMQMGLFGPVMIVVSFALLPAELWTYVMNPAGRWISRALTHWRLTDALLQRVASGLHNRFEPRRLMEIQLASVVPGWPRLRWVSRAGCDALALFFIVYVVLWNLDSMPGTSRRIPAEYAWIAPATGLDQFFSLFAPDPQTDDRWFVVAGELRNGRRVNALTGESTITYDRPANFYSTYVNQRWSAFLICLWTPNCSQYLDPFSRHLAHEWNRHHTGAEEMSSVEITFMHEIVRPNHTRSAVVPELYWTQRF